LGFTASGFHAWTRPRPPWPRSPLDAYDTTHNNPGGRDGFVSVLDLCEADLDDSGAVDFGDVLAILAAWGNPGGPEDLDGSGFVDFGDVLAVLSVWGPCP